MKIGIGKFNFSKLVCIIVSICFFSSSEILWGSIIEKHNLLRTPLFFSSLEQEILRVVDYIQRLLPEDGKSSREEILNNLISSNVSDPRRLSYTRNGKPHILPPTFLFKGSIFSTYKGKSKPRFIAITSSPKGIVITSIFSQTKNEKYILSKGGCRWYRVGESGITSMDEKFKGNKTKNLDPFLPEGVRLAESMSYKNPFWEVYFDGGKTIFLTERDVDKEEFIRDWVASSILAGVMMQLYIAGPDTYMGYREMEFVASAKEHALKEFGMPPTELLATTSFDPERFGTFPHEEWMATSIGVVETLITALGNDELVKRFDIDRNNLSLAIIGFGDVGGGVIKYLHDFYPDFFKLIKITLVADSKGAIYNEGGIDKNQLIKLLEIRKQEGSKFALKDYYDGEFELIKNTRDAYFKGATVLIPAARGTFVHTVDDIRMMHKAGTMIISEGANNFAAIGIEDKFERNGILFLYGPVANGGGIYASKEEVLHVLMEGQENIKLHMEERRLHIQGDIADTAIGNAMLLSKQLIERGKDASIYEIHQEVIDEIIRERSRLLDEPKEEERNEIDRRVRNDLQRGVKDTEQNRRVLTIVSASELAREIVIGRHLDPEDILRDLDSMDIATCRAAAYWAGKLRLKDAFNKLLEILRKSSANRSLRSVAAISLGYINNRKAVRQLEVMVESGSVAGDVLESVRWALNYMEADSSLSMHRRISDTSHFL